MKLRKKVAEDGANARDLATGKCLYFLYFCPIFSVNECIFSAPATRLELLRIVTRHVIRTAEGKAAKKKQEEARRREQEEKDAFYALRHGMEVEEDDVVEETTAQMMVRRRVQLEKRLDRAGGEPGGQAGTSAAAALEAAAEAQWEKHDGERFVYDDRKF